MKPMIRGFFHVVVFPLQHTAPIIFHLRRVTVVDNYAPFISPDNTRVQQLYESLQELLVSESRCLLTLFMNPPWHTSELYNSCCTYLSLQIYCMYSKVNITSVKKRWHTWLFMKHSSCLLFVRNELNRFTLCLGTERDNYSVQVKISYNWGTSLA